VRIALFSTSWFDFYVREIAEALSARHEVLVFVDQHDTLMQDLPRHVIVTRIPWLATRRHPLSNLRSIRRILSELGRFAPDIVHFQEHDPRFPLLLPFLRKRGVVLDLHNVEPLSGMEHPVRDWLRDVSHRRIGSVVVHGSSMRQALSARYGPQAGSAFVLPFGKFRAFGESDDARTASSVPTILFFGRIEPYKGLRTLVDAVPLVEQAFDGDFRVRIVGAGSLAHAFGSSGERPRIEVVNERVRDPAPYFRDCDVVVMPYTQASTSGVTPVAYAHSRPVIVTRTGSLPETVLEGKTGLVVPPNDPRALADAMLTLLRDPGLRTTMGKAAREMIDGPLDWSENIGQLELAYEAAASR
jgi:glycosyltransferase involved in cell wall biosynthesis